MQAFLLTNIFKAELSSAFILKNGSRREQRKVIMGKVLTAFDGDFVFPAQKWNPEEIRIHGIE